MFIEGREEEGRGREVAEKKDDVETGEIGRKELDEAEAERAEGKEVAEEKLVILSECC